MIEILKPLISQFMPFAQKQMGFDRTPKLFLKNDETEADNPMGKTGYYDPDNESITIYIGKRHPKDIMRSLSHELMHHTQKCNGDFDGVSNMGEQGYAQADDHLRTMEIQAYQASIVFRDWEDSTKGTIYYEHLQKGNKKMSTKDWKNGELTTILSEAFGFKFNVERLTEDTGGAGGELTDKEAKKEEEDKPYVSKREKEGNLEEEVVEEDDGDDIEETARGRRRGTSPDPARDDNRTRPMEEADDDVVEEDSGYEEKEHDEHNAWNDEDHIEAIEKHLRALKHDRDYEEDHESVEEASTHKLSTDSVRIEEKRLREIIRMALKESAKK